MLRNVTKYFELLHRKQPTATVHTPRPPHIPHVLTFSCSFSALASAHHQMTWERPVLPWSRTRPQFLSALPLSKRNPLSPRPQGASADPVVPPGTNTTFAFAFCFSLSLSFRFRFLIGTKWGREGKRRAAEPGAAQHHTTARCSDHLVPRHLHLHRPPLVSLKFFIVARAGAGGRGARARESCAPLAG